MARRRALTAAQKEAKRLRAERRRRARGAKPRGSGGPKPKETKQQARLRRQGRKVGDQSPPKAPKSVKGMKASREEIGKGRHRYRVGKQMVVANSKRGDYTHAAVFSAEGRGGDQFVTLHKSERAAKKKSGFGKGHYLKPKKIGVVAIEGKQQKSTKAAVKKSTGTKHANKSRTQGKVKSGMSKSKNTGRKRDRVVRDSKGRTPSQAKRAKRRKRK